jgi:drug/metabolite transporter (DMT)-like permease
MTPKQTGLALTSLGVFILSFDSLFVRLTNTNDWTLLFWRGALPTLMMLIVLLQRQSLKKTFTFSFKTFLAGALFSLSTITFVESLSHTQVASTLVIFDSSPLITALLGYLFLKETLAKHTIIAILTCVGGIWIVFAMGESTGAQWLGNLYALISAISMAAYFVLLRAQPDGDTKQYLMISGLITAGYALLAGGQPMAITPDHWHWLLILSLGIVPFSFLLISVGPRYLPAAEASLIMLLELLLGPLWVWIVLGDVPTVNVLIGGGVVLVTLMIHTLWDAKIQKVTV